MAIAVSTVIKEREAAVQVLCCAIHRKPLLALHGGENRGYCTRCVSRPPFKPFKHYPGIFFGPEEEAIKERAIVVPMCPKGHGALENVGEGDRSDWRGSRGTPLGLGYFLVL